MKLELNQLEGKAARVQSTIRVDIVLALRAPPKVKKQKAAPGSNRVRLRRSSASESSRRPSRLSRSMTTFHSDWDFRWGR